MTKLESSDSQSSSSSVGHLFSEANWLDTHFEVARPEYEEMVRDAEFQSGWHVLDAGCGGGSFLPLISELIGESGKITAIDLAPENVATIKHRALAGHFACEVQAYESSVTELAFEANSFDAIWNSNVVQYLTEAEFKAAVAEFYRVLRPGGMLALKEADMTALHFGPFEPNLLWHKLEDRYKNDSAIGCLHTMYLRRWLREAGFVTHSFKTYIGDDHHPLTDNQFQLCSGFLSHWADVALNAPDIPESEKEVWRLRIADVDAPTHIIHDPDFYLRRPYILILATVPE